MQRTQIYLPQDLKVQAEQLAAREGASMAEVVRRALAKEVSYHQTSGTNPLLALSKLNITGGPSDLSARLDEYLYDL